MNSCLEYFCVQFVAMFFLLAAVGLMTTTAYGQRGTDEFEGFTAEERTAGGNDKMRYVLMSRDADEPGGDGYKLVLILPGGDGSADFTPFCRRIHKNALPPGYVAAQLIAPAWSDDNDRVVWPTEQLNPDDAEFSTERLMAAVIRDIGEQLTIDKRNIFTLGWSSGGPPIYSAALFENSPITGTFVAMSVFKPNQLPGLEHADGRAFYLLHSPQDWINIEQHARVAEKQLGDAGARVKLQTYAGGHGWREDPFGHIRRGMQWLEEQNR